MMNELKIVLSIIIKGLLRIIKNLGYKNRIKTDAAAKGHLIQGQIFLDLKFEQTQIWSKLPSFKKREGWRAGWGQVSHG